jgi:ketosteroid isomerase-like protein
MRHLFLVVVVALMLAWSPAAAQAPDAQMMAPIKKFIDSFNKGDTAGAAATHLADADLVIVDEVPPYVWHGAKAFQSWAAALEADSKMNGISEPMVTISDPTRTETHGDHAYVVVPAVYSFKQTGAAMREAAQMTFVLKKGASGWLIHSWTWTGPKPQPAGGTAKP